MKFTAEKRRRIYLAGAFFLAAYKERCDRDPARVSMYVEKKFKMEISETRKFPEYIDGDFGKNNNHRIVAMLFAAELCRDKQFQASLKNK